MTGERDIAGIGVPLAAGVAAGALVFPSVSPGSIFLPILLLSVLLLLARYSFIRPGPSISAAFLLAGMFCSLNAFLTRGIPLPEGTLGRIARSCEAALSGEIDLIPYPSPSTGGLVKALLTGDRRGLDRQTIKIFRDSGASHILALSGLHLGIIYLLLNKLTRPLGNSPASRKARSFLVVATAGFYTIMTGAGPSIVRAFLFILLGETAGLTGRNKDTGRVLLSALTIQLAIKPEVISSLGFQLSYLSMTGIAFLYPHLKAIYPEDGLRWDPFRKIWQAASLSLSCQALTAPLAWLRFHTFPKYFLLTNLIALPLTSAVMVLSVATAALSLMGACPYFLVWLDDGAVRLLVRCLEIISSM